MFIGVDGCKNGWATVALKDGEVSRAILSVESSFLDLIRRYQEESIVVIDIPIGLPEKICGSGRRAEQATREGFRKRCAKGAQSRASSCFSMPSRSAVYQTELSDAKISALATSEPPRSISQQTFNILPKVREVDKVLADIGDRNVYESHPELAFSVLGDGFTMRHRKKSLGGQHERKSVLLANGFSEVFLSRMRPKGVALDDLYDACAMALIALRIADGSAKPFPIDFQRDARGLRVAIWA